MTTQKSRWLSLMLLLLLAAALRLTQLDLAEFKADEAGITRQALALVRQGHFPIIGPQSSQGPAHPPLQVYLMALPLALTPDPRLAIAVIALIHTAGVGMTLVLGARFFSRRVGFIAAALLAVNPWAIYYARKMWTQNWPLATTLFIFFLLLLIVERRPWALLGASLALVALVGTHLGGLVFLIILVLILLPFRAQLQRRPLLVSVAVLVLCAAPYLYHDAGTHGWANLRGFLDLGGGPAQIDWQATRFAVWLSSGYHYQDLAGTRYAQFLDTLPPLRWLDGVEMALLGLGVIYLIARIVRQAQEKDRPRPASLGRNLVLLLWLLVPVALQTRHTQPVYPHYFILLYPVQHLIIALLLSDGLAQLQKRYGPRWGRYGMISVVGLLLLIGGWQIYLNRAFNRFVTQHDTPNGYGPTVGPLWQTAQAAGAAAQACGAEILLVAQGDDPLWDNRPAALDVLLPRHLPHRLIDGREALVFPLGPAVYITTPDVQTATVQLRALSGTTALDPIAAPGNTRYWLFQRDNASRDDVLAGLTPLSAPRRLANGVEWLAYGIDDAQSHQPLQFSVAWWLDGPAPTGIDYHLFVHLVDAEGKRWGQHDMAGLDSAAWQTGDLVLTRFSIETNADAPQGQYWIHLGMYTFPDIVNVPVLDAAGNPAGDLKVVGPVLLR